MTSKLLLTGLALTAMITAEAKEVAATPPKPGTKANPTASVRDRRETKFGTAPQENVRRNAKAADNDEVIYELPFRHDIQSLEPEQVISEYTFIDLDGDAVIAGESAQYNQWFFKPDENLIQYCVDQDNPVSGNDWLIGPGIHLDGKNIYHLGVDINMGARSDIRLTIGTSKNPADHKTVLDLPNLNDGWWTTNHGADFTVPEDGIYYVGIYNYTAPEGFYLNLFSIDVKAGMSADVPQQPSDFSVMADENGVLGATVSFVTPELNAVGKPLAGTVTMKILRNDQEVESLECAPGQSVTWHDDNPANGYNTYRVVGVKDGKEGVDISSTVWVGSDLPGNITLNTLRTVNNNMNVYLDWSECTSGKNGGYFDPSKVTYSVYRGYDRNQMEVIAEGLTGTSFTDEAISSLIGDRQAGYFYGVSAVNEAGMTLSNARIVAVGKPYSFPQKESFTNGRLNLDPWLTESLAGDFSWSIVGSDSGVNPIDHDNGMTKFYSYWGDWTDSRLKSPVFTLDRTDDPVFNVWMLHWNEEDVSWDGGATRMIVEISVDGGDWTQLGEPLPAGTTYGWAEHTFSLAEYKDAETVQIALRGQTDNDWMYFYVDALTFEDKIEADLMLTEFYGSTEADIDETCAWAVSYFNRGYDVSTEIEIEIYDGENLLTSYPAEDLQPGEKGYAVIYYTFSAAQTGMHNLWAKVVCDCDEEDGNDCSQVLDVYVKPSSYPAVTDIWGDMNSDGDPELSWAAPSLPSKDEALTDGAEEYPSWAVSGFGDWLSIDLDQQGSGRYNNLPAWPNSEINQAFMVWAPTEEMLAIEPTLRPYSGDKCFICWMANEFDWWSWDDPVNNDWLISPEVGPGSEISFMVRGDYTPGESYEVLYSNAGRDPEEFTSLLSTEAADEWEKVNVRLPEDARYFAIRYTGSFRGCLMVDDISYTSINAWLELEGYDVFRDGLKINDSLVADCDYTDVKAPVGSHYYSVAAVYDRGTSNASDEVCVLATGIENVKDNVLNVKVSKGMLEVTSSVASIVEITDATGMTIFSGMVEGTRSFSLASGIYIVKCGDTASKAIL